MHNDPEKIGLMRCDGCGRYLVEGVCGYCDECTVDLSYYIAAGFK